MDYVTRARADKLGDKVYYSTIYEHIISGNYPVVTTNTRKRAPPQPDVADDSAAPPLQPTTDNTPTPTLTPRTPVHTCLLSPAAIRGAEMTLVIPANFTPAEYVEQVISKNPLHDKNIPCKLLHSETLRPKLRQTRARHNATIRSTLFESGIDPAAWIQTLDQSLQWPQHSRMPPLSATTCKRPTADDDGNNNQQPATRGTRRTRARIAPDPHTTTGTPPAHTTRIPRDKRDEMSALYKDN